MRTSISALLNPTPSFALPPPHAPSSPSSPSSSSSDPSSSSRHDDLRRNRDTSSRHRQAQRQAVASAQEDLQTLQASRTVLEAQTAALVASGALPPTLLPGDLLAASSSYRSRNTHDAFEPFSPATAQILGEPTVSEPVALVLLEMVAIRRGVAFVCPKGLTSAEASRFTTREFDALAGDLAYYADTGLPVPHHLYSVRLEELCTLYVRWDANESRHDWFRSHHAFAAADVDDGTEDTDEDENDGGGADGSTVKRCRRCHVLKTAGSGHRRSHCDDGMLVSSHIAFPSASGPLNASPFYSAAEDSSESAYGNTFRGHY